MTKEKRNAYMQEYGKRPEVRARRRARRAKLSLTPEQIQSRRAQNLSVQHKSRWGAGYAERLQTQGNACALCGESFDETSLGRPAQDHDHATGELREFLHRRCNLGIGNFLDNPALCRKAAEYLERHKGKL